MSEGADAWIDVRLVPSAVAAWAAAWWSVTGSVAEVLLASGVAAILLVVVSAGLGTGSQTRPVVAGATVVLAAVTTVLSITGLHLVQRQRDPVARWASQRPAVLLAGRVSADPQPVASRRFRFGRGQEWVVHVAADRLEVRGGRLRSAAEVVLVADGSWSAVAVGAHVAARGRLMPADPGQVEQALLMVRGPPQVLDRGRVAVAAGGTAAGRSAAGVHRSAGRSAGLLPAWSRATPPGWIRCCARICRRPASPT